MANENNKKLAGEFQKELTRQKARELGVSADSLTTKVQDGKNVWIEKTQLYSELEKQRQIASKKVIRSIRGGENSLHNCILLEVKRVMALLNEEESLNAIDRHDYSVSVNKIHSSADTWAKQISGFEDQIEQAKKSDPVFEQGERVMQEMLKAQKAGEQSRIVELKSAYSDLLKKYDRRRKSISPYIDSARISRLSLQKEYWKILQTGWKIRNDVILGVIKTFDALPREVRTTELSNDFNSVRELFNSLNEIGDSLKARAPGSTGDPIALSEAWNPILNEFKSIVDRQVDLWIQVKFLSNQIQAIESKTRIGMVFQDQKRNNSRR
jgi:HPt (histidine-containing phosphotransfer) domain-containing protein